MGFLKRYLYDRQGNFKIPVLKTPLFWWVLGVKVVVSFLFIAHYSESLLYPNLTLWLLAVPRLIIGLFLILADFAIFLILARWLKTRQNAVLKYYWCSPILFFISYVYGQLDVIPIALLFIFLYLLFKEKFYAAFTFLGLAISVKTGILIVWPLAIVYLLLKKIGFKNVLLLSLLPLVLFILLNLNHILSPNFYNLVFGVSKESHIFDFKLKLTENFVIYLLPFIYLLLLAKSLTYRTYNRDIFLMFLGFSFCLLMLFIPPMPGWYFWITPFLVYFYVKQKDAPIFSFVALNVFYFLYFLLIPNFDLFRIFIPASAAVTVPNLYGVISKIGYNPLVLSNVIFSLLQATLFLNVFWIYRKGIESNTRYKISYQPYLIGLSGDSGAGKTTVAGLLRDVFGAKNTALVEGDDMHRWERGNEMWKKFTHLDPRANYLHADLEHALRLRKGTDVIRRHYDHSQGVFTLPGKLESKKIVIFEGLHSLFLTRMRDILDLKIFLRPDDDLRLHWKILRDIKERGHSKEKILKQVKQRFEDSRQYIQIQEQYSDITVSFKNSSELGEKIGSEEAMLGISLAIKGPDYLNIDPLLFALNEKSNIQASHSFSEDFQTVEFKGSVSSEAIDSIAYSLFPELWDVIIDEPKWRSNYDGLIQLFVCYYIFEQMKLEEHEKRAD